MNIICNAYAMCNAFAYVLCNAILYIRPKLSKKDRTYKNNNGIVISFIMYIYILYLKYLKSFRLFSGRRHSHKRMGRCK